MIKGISILICLFVSTCLKKNLIVDIKICDEPKGAQSIDSIWINHMWPQPLETDA